MNLTRKLIENHLISGQMKPGREIALRMDQTLTQDATGTLVMLELEAMELDRVRTELSAQYVDHNLIQEDHRNPDDHLFLRSACQRFGVWYSPPGNGVSHPVHQERFGIPGKTLVGSDSHTPAAGGLGMLAFGAGGLEVALAMAGKPLHLAMPKVVGVRVEGQLPPWVSAKDVILEMLRRHGVKGGVGKIYEYYGPGLKSLSVMDRHVIANMGTELGATSTVFPSDANTRNFLRQQHREDDFLQLSADEDASYDEDEEIILDELVPMIALPSSPGNVKRVDEVAGEDIYQAYIGSSANPGMRDFAVPAMMVRDRRIHDRVSFDINPTSRQILENLTALGYLGPLIASGARLHQAGCNGCIGMGQAPATGRNSLRTVPRNFPSRSGTREDRVFLCSPETATASALSGKITDPRTMDFDCPEFQEPGEITLNSEMLIAPPDEDNQFEPVKGPNIKSLPPLEPLPEQVTGPVVLKVGDNISTDEILPAGAEILPYRSNIPKISTYTFCVVDESFSERAMEHQVAGFFIVAGENYGQGSSREHAALAPRYLGLRAVIAKSFARIHWQNLINFGVLPLTFRTGEDYRNIKQDDLLRLENTFPHNGSGSASWRLLRVEDNKPIGVEHSLSPRQLEVMKAGSLINHTKAELASA